VFVAGVESVGDFGRWRAYPTFHILLTPWLAAAAMALSSVCVLGNSPRLRSWQPSL
jgi:Cu+-exporting ATPase